MTTNGKLPPAPPVRPHTVEDRLARIEEAAGRADQGKLWREVQALRSEVAVLDNRVTVVQQTRDGVFDSLQEISAAMFRQQRVVDRLERQVHELIVELHEMAKARSA